MREGVTCRGSLALGTGCGRCAKCETERGLLQNAAIVGERQFGKALEIWPADVPGAPPVNVKATSPIDAAIEVIGGMIKSGAPIASPADAPKPIMDDYLVRGGEGDLVRVRCRIVPGFVMIGQMRTCRRCGCVDDRACAGGCSWVEDTLCSKCVEVN